MGYSIKGDRFVMSDLFLDPLIFRLIQLIPKLAFSDFVQI